MASLKTYYMGFELKSPIIIASSGLTKSIDNLLEYEKNGAGAVVLKSLFEEQIQSEINKNLSHADQNFNYPESYDYISNFSKSNAVDEYISLISEAKQKLSIPVIASINCVSDNEWVEQAKRFQDAGADALELNIFVLPSDYNKTNEEIEKIYFDIIEDVKKHVSIPIAIKISEYFTSLAKMAITLSWTGIKGLVLFNRTYSPDIDINNMKINSANMFSSPLEVSLPLRWIALLSDKSHCDLAGSTGVHDGESVVKLLLSGAAAVQVCSVLYKKKASVIKEMNDFVEDWMNKNNFKTIEEFKGKMNYKNIPNPSAFERVQFMKYFSGIE